MNFSQPGNFEDFLELLNVPCACKLNKPIFKKMFLEATDDKKATLSTADKKALKEDVEKIRWLYTLKPSTINIAPYKDHEREYPEIAILYIELARPDKFKRIAQFINRAIPYPLILLFSCENEGKSKMLTALADKRINHADKEKWVIENSLHTQWINLSSITTAERQFFESLKLSNLSFTDFFSFYQSVMDRVIAIKCAEQSGEFTLLSADAKDETTSGTLRLAKLRLLEKLEAQSCELSNKLKKINQMGKQVKLNTQIKKINDEIASIKGSL